MATAQKPLTGVALSSYIAAGARKRGLDPNAVLSIVPHEGGFAMAIGDNGTSFGPFQLHKGGALPAGLTDPATWANTPAGLDYALDKIAAVASGQSGHPAIVNIVTRFERPADPAYEIGLADTTYLKLTNQSGSAQDASLLGDVYGAAGGLLGGAAGAAKDAAGSAGSSLLPDWFSWDNIGRIGEFAFGGILTVLGIVLLAMSAGSSTPAGQVAGAVGGVASVAKKVPKA